MNQTFLDKLADETVSGLKGSFAQSINAGEDPTTCMQKLLAFLESNKEGMPQFLKGIASRVDSTLFAPVKVVDQIGSPDDFIAAYHDLLKTLLEICPELPYKSDYNRQRALIDDAEHRVRNRIRTEKLEKKRVVDDEYGRIVSERKKRYRKTGGGKSHRKRIVLSLVIGICLLVPLLLNTFVPPSATKDRVATGPPRPALQTTSVHFGTQRLQAASSTQSDVLIWNVMTKRSVRTLTGNEQFAYRTTFSSDGSRLAAVDGEGTITVWDLASGGVEDSFAVGKRPINVPLFFSPDGTRLAVATGDAIVVSDLTWKQEPLTIPTTFPWSASFSSDGTRLASGTSDTVSIWNLETGGAARSLHGETDSAIRSTAFSPDGTRLAVGAADGTLSIWDLAADQVERSITLGRSPLKLCFSPNGTKLSTALGSNLIVWDLTTGETIALRSGTNAAVQAMVAFSPDGTRLASIHGLSEIIVWDLARTRPFVPFVPGQLLYVVLLFGAIVIVSAIAYGYQLQAIGLTPDETSAYDSSLSSIEKHFSDKEEWEISESTLDIVTGGDS